MALACLSTKRVSLPPGVHEDPGLCAGKLSGRFELEGEEGRNLDVMFEMEVARP